MLEHLSTEHRLSKTMDLDIMQTMELLHVMNEEDCTVPLCVQQELPHIARSVEKISAAFQNGGRLLYMGAGTSGRLGLLDAVECPPTFNTQPDQVLGLIAGGSQAFLKAVEGAEDCFEEGAKDLKNVQLTSRDVVVGIAASGRTPYVMGGLTYAHSLGATTIALSCNKNASISKLADIAIEVETGPEILTGSTRLKAGTAQKLVCNMLSTAAMVLQGKVYGNLMVDLQLTNEKLIERGKRIVMEATECSYDEATYYLEKANNRPKVAIVMLLTNVNEQEAVEKLDAARGFIRQSIVD
ncbi:N-acetylmuramic acid-6-phosphate etherase [Fictibacillus macauensis ZFHKF-1]|uniref:N-acetylmuramic acid 6-phosphate etherase n=1 Tax=Fictibacillus macauensis ZFHKF-1 TaxID=1196324 RepID=I8AL85_9BACL|nr:N-acetylmuramic acid-6-phosphate etherase [Fictibacillus macauensis ZFHKF-1]